MQHEISVVQRFGYFINSIITADIYPGYTVLIISSISPILLKKDEFYLVLVEVSLIPN